MNFDSQTIIEDNIDFWYDSLNDCYNNDMAIDMVLTYIEAITDEDSEESVHHRLTFPPFAAILRA